MVYLNRPGFGRDLLLGSGDQAGQVAYLVQGLELGWGRPPQASGFAGEQSLARPLYRRLEQDWLLLADRNFYNWADWRAAADSGAQLLWRVKADLRLSRLQVLADGSYISVLIDPKIRGEATLRSTNSRHVGSCTLGPPARSGLPGVVPSDPGPGRPVYDRPLIFLVVIEHESSSLAS
jgi:hypothetical protein